MAPVRISVRGLGTNHVKMRCGMRFGIPAAMSAAVIIASVLPAQAESIGDKTAQKQAEIPNCSHKMGTLAIH